MYRHHESASPYFDVPVHAYPMHRDAVLMPPGEVPENAAGATWESSTLG